MMLTSLWFHGPQDMSALWWSDPAWPGIALRSTDDCEESRCWRMLPRKSDDWKKMQTNVTTIQRKENICSLWNINLNSCCVVLDHREIIGGRWRSRSNQRRTGNSRMGPTKLVTSRVLEIVHLRGLENCEPQGSWRFFLLGAHQTPSCSHLAQVH